LTHRSHVGQESILPLPNTTNMTLEEQFTRLVRTLQLIEQEPGKWDVARLELEFGVGRATIERDIRILRKWGTIERKEGCFAVKSLKFLPRSFTPSEALALVLAGSMACERMGMPPTEAMRTALAKIDTVLPEQVSSMIKKMRKRVSIGVNLIREFNSETLDQISKAISSHNPLELSYYVITRNELTKRRVDPYGLTFRFGAWYLIGYCHLREEVRTFGVDRIRSMRLVNDHFKYPEGFDLEGYLERGWSLQADAQQETIVLHFDKGITPWISNCKFHPSQKITQRPDGSSIFEVTVAGVDEIKHWVLSFGDKVEVLEPKSLRTAIADECREMARKYKPADLYPQPSPEPMYVHESREG